MFGGCYFGQHSDLQHVVPLFYSKILLKKTIIRACSSLLCSETTPEGGKFVPLAVEEFGGCLVPWKASSALTPLSTQLFWPHFPGMSHRGEASAVCRGSQNVSQLHHTHVQESLFTEGGGKSAETAPNCWKHQQNPCGSVQGLERAPCSLSAALHAASF